MAASSTSAVSRELPVAAAELISRTKKKQQQHAVTDTFLLASIPLKIYWIPVMSHFSDLSNITLNMYYINSSHLPPSPFPWTPSRPLCYTFRVYAQKLH